MTVNTRNIKLDISKCGQDLLNWDKDKQEAAKARIWDEFGLHQFCEDKSIELRKQISDEEYEFLLDTFNVREHFVVTLSHRKFIKKSFARFQKFFQSINLTEEQVNKHDDSKLTSFLEIIGYTQRWVWELKTDIWEEAWKHHYTTNSHHPEYYIHSAEDGQSIQNDMNYLDMVESVVDMLACRWERKLNGNEFVTCNELLDIQEFFFNRYTSSDRARVKQLLIQLSNLEYDKKKEP